MLADLPRLLSDYGPPIIFLITLFAAFGLPSPATMALLAAGALSSFGQIDLPWVIAAGLAGTVAGDHLVRALAAKTLGRKLAGRLSGPIATANRIIDRWGMIGVFGSRFIFPTIMTPGVNYFCGIARYPLGRFTPAVVAGETVYVSGYVTLGREFSSQLRQVQSIATTASLLILVLMVAVACAFLLLRHLFRK